jgi:hypothetical protein
MSKADLPKLEAQLDEILRTLVKLPSDQVREVHDFVLFLEERYGELGTVSIANDWSDEDIRELVAASIAYAEQGLEDSAETSRSAIGARCSSTCGPLRPLPDS